MRDINFATSFAIFTAKQRGTDEVTSDDLLLGCLRALSRFGVAEIGQWDLDLEALGVDWFRQPQGPPPKVSYSQEAVELFDRAAQIAKSDANAGLNLNHLLAAFGAEERGLMADLKRKYGITSALWRAAVARLGRDDTTCTKLDHSEKKNEREYLTPEEAAETLGVHVQTMRGYVRTGRLPAFRVAGERAIRILRTDLTKVLEPLETEK